jgi:uncharacterized protein involved in outer membrane biogenesis
LFEIAVIFTAKRLRIGVQVKPLIFNSQLIVRSFEVDAPQIHLIRAEDGTWNFSTLSHGAGSQNTTQPATLPDLPIGLITIEDGNAKIRKRHHREGRTRDARPAPRSKAGN